MTVNKIPVEELLVDGQQLDALRIRHVSDEDITNLLVQGQVAFVVASVGDPLDWIDTSNSNDFWENEAKYRIAFPDEEIMLDDYPDAYCYVASEWAPYSGGTLILLEKYS